MEKLFCRQCEKRTKHIPKLDAEKAGNMVCDICHIQNPKRWLYRLEDGLVKTSSSHIWLEFDEDGKFKEKHTKPKVGYSLLLSPFNIYFAWQTTEITEIMEESEGYIKFKTKSSTYELKY